MQRQQGTGDASAVQGRDVGCGMWDVGCGMWDAGAAATTIPRSSGNLPAQTQQRWPKRLITLHPGISCWNNFNQTNG